MSVSLVPVNREDGTPYQNYRTFGVMCDGKRIGTLQCVRGMDDRDDGRRHAWLGHGVAAREHLGVFANQDAAIKAIEAGKLGPNKGKFRP